MSKYLNCQRDIIQLMAIMEITDGKFDTVFDYDRKDPDKFIKFIAKYGVEGSDHLTMLNIYKNLYLAKKSNDSTTISKYLNKKSLGLIDNRVRQLFTYANSIPANVYQRINAKYKLVSDKVIGISQTTSQNTSQIITSQITTSQITTSQITTSQTASQTTSQTELSDLSENYSYSSESNDSTKLTELTESTDSAKLTKSVDLETEQKTPTQLPDYVKKNILITLGLAFKYNLLKKEAKNVYVSLNFLTNSVAPVEYSIITPIPKNPSQHVICHSLVNVFGNKSFQCITEIPEEIINMT